MCLADYELLKTNMPSQKKVFAVMAAVLVAAACGVVIFLSPDRLHRDDRILRDRIVKMFQRPDLYSETARQKVFSDLANSKSDVKVLEQVVDRVETDPALITELDWFLVQYISIAPDSCALISLSKRVDAIASSQSRIESAILAAFACPSGCDWFVAQIATHQERFSDKSLKYAVAYAADKGCLVDWSIVSSRQDEELGVFLEIVLASDRNNNAVSIGRLSDRVRAIQTPFLRSVAEQRLERISTQVPPNP